MVGERAAAIMLRGVSKRYGKVTALASVDLIVAPGRILGFLGPNGAGKTTTIRILTGFLKPSAGTVSLLGHDMRDASSAIKARRSLGFVPETPGFDTGVTGRWLLDYLARLQGSVPVDRDRLATALALTDRDLRRPIGRLSKGTRQKINIVQGLQHRPDLLMLDEPGEGLDPLARRALFRLLARARERGATVFISSHVLSEVQALCDEVALIQNGRIGFVGDIGNIQRGMQRRVTLALDEDGDAEVEQKLRSLPTLSRLTIHNGRRQFYVADVGPLLRLLSELTVRDLVIEPASLEDVFLQFYEPGGGSDE